jgi:hypothetical protein
MTLEPSKEPSLCLLTLTAVDVLSNRLHREFKEWCPLLLVDTNTTVKKEELHQDLQQNNPRLNLWLSCSLPYIIDYWHDLHPQERASIQVQMLSMSKINMVNVSYRVSTARNEFIVMIPVSKYFGQPDTAFNYYVLREMKPDDHSAHISSLQYHPKSIARLLHLSELRSKSPSVNTVMEFRIPLRGQYSLDFATTLDNDPYFYGAKFVEYPDGSFHLHAELVADTV